MSIEIRRTEPSDYEDIVQIMACPSVYAGTMQLPYPSAEAWRKKLAEPPTGFYNLAAVADGVVVGTVGLHTHPNSPRTAHAADLGITVRDDWQGQGVGSTLMAAAIDLADNWLGLHRIGLSVFTDNAPAIALYEKFGFETEGVVSDLILRDGEFCDVYFMARIKASQSTRRVARESDSRWSDTCPAHSKPVGCRQSSSSQQRGTHMTIDIRRAEPSDYEDVALIMASPSVYAGTMQLPYPSVESWRQKMANPPSGHYHLVAVADGVVIATCGLHTHMGSPRAAHSASLGITVRDDWQGQGVGSALMAAALDLADNWLGLHRIGLEVFTDNQAAIALYEKFGFEKEGVGRDYALRDGAYCDVLYMARIRPKA